MKHIRYMKALLTCMFSFLGTFFTACFISWLITGDEPEALITGVSTACGMEALVAGAIRIFENIQHHDHEKEMQDHGQNCCDCEESRLEGEIDEP